MADLIELLPDCYKNSTQIVELQGALQHWTDALQAAGDDMFLQMNVETATWGLVTWETALGIPTDATKPNEYRRTRIMSKLRGQGATTKAMIENVAESFSNGDVAIIEYNSESRFEVKFVGTLGIPPNMDDLKAAIDEIKPAHLAYSFVYVYRTWDMVSTYTWNQLAARTWDELREGAL